MGDVTTLESKNGTIFVNRTMSRILDRPSYFAKMVAAINLVTLKFMRM